MRVVRRYAARKTVARWLSILVLMVVSGRVQTLVSSQSSPQSEKFDGPAELPRIYVDSSLTATPAPGRTLLVHAGEDPSQVLAKASCGDTVELQAGTTFSNLL